jgi:hypothetical protein
VRSPLVSKLISGRSLKSRQATDGAEEGRPPAGALFGSAPAVSIRATTEEGAFDPSAAASRAPSPIAREPCGNQASGAPIPTFPRTCGRSSGLRVPAAPPGTIALVQPSFAVFGRASDRASAAHPTVPHGRPGSEKPKQWSPERARATLAASDR